MSRWWSSIRMPLKLFLFLFIFNKSCPLIPWFIIFFWVLQSFLFLEILHCYSYCLGRKVFVCVYRFWLISELVEVCRSQREREAIGEGSWTTRNTTAGRVLFHFCHLKNLPFSKIEGEFSGSGTPLLDFTSHSVNLGVTAYSLLASLPGFTPGQGIVQNPEFFSFLTVLDTQSWWVSHRFAKDLSPAQTSFPPVALNYMLVKFSFDPFSYLAGISKSLWYDDRKTHKHLYFFNVMWY